MSAAIQKESPQAGELEGIQHNTLQGRSTDNFNVREDAGQVARFTALFAARPVAKRYELCAGKLKSKPVRSEKYFKNVPVEVACIKDLATAFSEADAKVIFVGGSSAAPTGEKIRRKKEELPFKKQPGVMFLDNDVQDGGDQFFDLYVAACPAMASASYVHSPSSSAWILRESDGEVLRDAGGQHYAVPVLDATDIPRALEALHQRCVLAGLGSIKVSERGVPLERSPVDKAMRTGHQPLFTRVDLGPGLVQAKNERITAHAGEVFLFDTGLIKSLSAYELTQYHAEIATLKAAKAGEVEEVGAQWVAARVQDVAKAQHIDKAAATAYLQKLQRVAIRDKAHADLVAGVKLVFESGDVDVAEVLANPAKYHDKPCADPLEPSYRGGVGTAKFYAFDASGKPHTTPLVSSMAHGVMTIYHLKRDLSHIDIDIAGVIQKAQEAQSAEGVVHVPAEAAPAHGGAVVAAESGSDLAGFHILEMPSGIKATEFVIDGFLPNGVTVISGAPGAGKTTNLEPLAASVAHLAPAAWGFHPKRRRVVVWLSEHPEQVFDTMEAIMREDGAAIREEWAQWFKVVPTKRSSPEALADLIVAVNKRFSEQNERGVWIRPLIVWDTAAATIKVDNENDNTAISDAISTAKRVLDGGALWVVHHTPKADKDADSVQAMSARGGGAFEGDANCTAYLFTDKQTGRRVLGLGKIRFAPEFTEVHFDSARHTETIVDDFDGQELDKTVTAGIPSRGTKEGRQAEKKDTYQAAQMDAILQAAVEAAHAGIVCSRNDIHGRLTLGVRKQDFGPMVNRMISNGVLMEVDIPRQVHRSLKLNNKKTALILPASVVPASVFEAALRHSVGSGDSETIGADSVKFEGGQP